jgi:hypothetical protein
LLGAQVLPDPLHQRPELVLAVGNVEEIGEPLEDRIQVCDDIFQLTGELRRVIPFTLSLNARSLSLLIRV